MNIIFLDVDGVLNYQNTKNKVNGNEEDNRKSWKEKFIGCYITVEKSHIYDEIKVYRCLELEEYFTENEIELINSV